MWSRSKPQIAVKSIPRLCIVCAATEDFRDCNKATHVVELSDIVFDMCDTCYKDYKDKVRELGLDEVTPSI